MKNEWYVIRKRERCSGNLYTEVAESEEAANAKAHKYAEQGYVAWVCQKKSEFKMIQQVVTV